MGDRSFVSIVVGSDTRSVQEIYLPGSFERHLQDPIAEFGAVERIDSDKSVLVIGHRYEAVAFALLSLEIANDLDAGDGAVGSKQLPQNVLVSSGGEVVDEDADAEAWGLADGGLGHRGRSGASHAHAAEQLWRDSFDAQAKIYVRKKIVDSRSEISSLMKHRSTSRGSQPSGR